ncbi:hypothetical protein FQN60_012747 [Etheostoma spectabile]|uniref:Uncharacterized protein n=1 Tax=Etheostoma spectabile TaxID=54343 RepID=A0A5J5D3T3_9PERO|nr:hypothetical protein FQN60_012747 [Etheostoma spectabile]
MRSASPTQHLFTPDRLLPSLRADREGTDRKKCEEGWNGGGVRRQTQSINSSPLKPSCGCRVHGQTPPQCGSGRVTTGPGGLGKHWPIQPTQAPHWVVQYSSGTSGHITAQRSCFMSNNSRNSENRSGRSKPNGLLQKC